MPITRAELLRKYQENYVKSIDSLISCTVEEISRQIETANSHGSTSYSHDLTYRPYWTLPSIDKLIDKLKVHYPDSDIYSIAKIVKINWKLDEKDDVSDAPKNTAVVKTTEDDKNIQINISLPSRISTRSSTRKG
jgi:hypothetical protein